MTDHTRQDTPEDTMEDTMEDTPEDRSRWNQERSRWNEIYAAGSHTSLQADAFLTRAYDEFVAPALQPGGFTAMRALDLAGGVGRNALWLAERGWRVLLTDVSDQAVQRAQANAQARRLSLHTRREPAADTLAWAARTQARFELIAMLFFLERPLFSALRQALARGGMLLVKTRTEEHERFKNQTGHPDYYLKPGELAAAFPGVDVLHAEERDGIAELVARAR